jgi:pimeloyl-ACP methyl ester carboxylesterase
MYAMEPASDKHGRKTLRRLGHDPDSLPTEVTVLQGRLEALPTYRTHWLSLLENVYAGGRQSISLTRDEFTRIRQPVRFVWGDRDPFGAPGAGEAVCKVAPDARLTSLPAGHLPWLDEPGHCAAVVQELIERR